MNKQFFFDNVNYENITYAFLPVLKLMLRNGRFGLHLPSQNDVLVPLLRIDESPYHGDLDQTHTFLHLVEFVGGRTRVLSEIGLRQVGDHQDVFDVVLVSLQCNLRRIFSDVHAVFLPNDDWCGVGVHGAF